MKIDRIPFYSIILIAFLTSCQGATQFLNGITFNGKSVKEYANIYNNTSSTSSTDEIIEEHDTPISVAKEVITVNGVSFTMIEIEGGKFTMGATKVQSTSSDDNEKPEHMVALTTYKIGETEVTQELWKAVMFNNPSYFNGNLLPVESVTWNDCQEFIRRLNDITGRNFRLPTEAEWEYAARGGKNKRDYKYSGSNNIDEVAWFRSNSDGTTHRVGSKLPNRLGIYDMSGNVWEWCQDWYGNYYDIGLEQNPTGPNSGTRKVLRGGSWFFVDRTCRISMRSGNEPTCRAYNIGLRLAL